MEDASMNDFGTDAIETPDRIRALRYDVINCLQEASVPDLADNRNYFVPRDKTIDFFNREKVVQLLQALLGYSQDVEHLADIISPPEGSCRCGNGHCTGARIIFAALIQLGKERCIRHFLDFDVCDTKYDPDSEPAIAETWTKQERALFWRHQLQMKSPFIELFDREEFQPPTFNSQLSLPLEYLRELKDIPGQTANVFETKIYASYGGLELTENHSALKRLKPTRELEKLEKLFDDEIAAHKRLKGLHPRIVELLAAFWHKDVPHLIFPWAEGGTLKEFWESPSNFSEPWCHSEWVLNECRGLAEAVAHMHLQPRDAHSPARGSAPQVHADIASTNILVFLSNVSGEAPIFKLADLGRSKEVDDKGQVKDPTLQGTFSYSPPESEKGIMKRKHSTAWDIWSLACVYLEFATWYIDGKQRWESFGEARQQEEHRHWRFFSPKCSSDNFYRQRTFVYGFTRTMRNFMVKRSVTLHIDQLRKHGRCDPLMRKLLDFVEQQMLIVDDKQRAPITDVTEFFKGLDIEASEP